jgi:hypothetical protein
MHRNQETEQMNANSWFSYVADTMITHNMNYSNDQQMINFYFISLNIHNIKMSEIKFVDLNEVKFN